MLNPKSLGLGSALRNQMRILNIGIVGAFGRHIFGAHSFATGVPSPSTVPGDPRAAAGNSKNNVIGVARTHADRMNAGIFRATTEPFLAFWTIPKRTDQFP